MMNLKSKDDLKFAQRERLTFIDFSLAFFGKISRAELITAFETGHANGTRDLALYKALAPDNMQIEQSIKVYYRTENFQPLFDHDANIALTRFSQTNILASREGKSSAFIDAVRLVHPKFDITSSITRAIVQRKALKVKYVSLSNGEQARIVVPHSVVNSGHRWHVRAYDRESNEFRDFVITRFTSSHILSIDVVDNELIEADLEWNRDVNVQLQVHPRIKNKKAIELDYEMEDGVLNLKVKSALVGYLLNQWRVDCSEELNLTSDEFQLALKQRNELEGVKSMILAPGYFNHREDLR